MINEGFIDNLGLIINSEQVILEEFLNFIKTSRSY